MRKVTEKAAQALRAKEHMKSGNTEVRKMILHPGQVEIWAMFLHGNPIAVLQNNTLTLGDCRWRTATTKERLNGVLDTFNTGTYIQQLDGVWYVHDKHGNNSVWYGNLTVEVNY